MSPRPDTSPFDGHDPSGSWRRGDDDSARLIRDLVALAARHDGVAAVSGHVLDALDSASVDYLVIRRDGALAGAPPAGAALSGGALVGAAVAVGGDPAEVVVEPGSRGRGYGSALVEAALDRQGGVWAYGDLPAAAAVAARLGLHRGRVLLQMRRYAESSPPDEGVPITHSKSTEQSLPSGQMTHAGAGELPAGVRIRTFVPGQDEDAFLAVNARAFSWHPEQGRLDLAGLRAEMAQDWFDPAGFFLAVSTAADSAASDSAASDGTASDRTASDADAERLLGFHWTKVHTQDPNPGDGNGPGPIGEVYVLGVDPEAGIRGLGTPLTAIGLDYLRGRGLDTVMLYVEGDNDRAVRLYERFGFSTFLANVVYQRSEPAQR